MGDIKDAALRHARIFRIVVSRIDDGLLRAHLDNEFQLQRGRQCSIVYDACSDTDFRQTPLSRVHTFPKPESHNRKYDIWHVSGTRMTLPLMLTACAMICVCNSPAQWCRQKVSHGALVLPANGGSDMTSCVVAAAIMLHLIQPDAFGIDTAAAACVALAAPFLQDPAAEPHMHDGSLVEMHHVHRFMALGNPGQLNAALRVPGFPAAVAAEHPAALAALATECLDSELNFAAAAFAPAAVEVNTLQQPQDPELHPAQRTHICCSLISTPGPLQCVICSEACLFSTQLACQSVSRCRLVVGCADRGVCLQAARAS